MTVKEAKHIVEQQVMVDKVDCAIIPDSITEHETCFTIHYQSKSYLTSGNMGKMLVGHGPVIVDKLTGKVFETGSAYFEERYVMAYEACGDPLANPTNNIAVQGWLADAEKISATKLIKKVSKLTLKEAKNVIDNALKDQTTIFVVTPMYNASEVVKKLNDIGFKCTQLWATS